MYFHLHTCKIFRKSCWYRFNISYQNHEKKNISPTGNWTPVSRVTGGDTDHYTVED